MIHAAEGLAAQSGSLVRDRPDVAPVLHSFARDGHDLQAQSNKPNLPLIILQNSPKSTPRKMPRGILIAAGPAVLVQSTFVDH